MENHPMQTYHLKNRPNREITNEAEIDNLFLNGKFAILSLCRNNEPYIVTLSYGYDPINKILYFHCAKEGLKMDFIKSNPIVCGTVIEDGGYIENECGHAYKSLVFWGSIEIVSGLENKKTGLGIILNHLEKDSEMIRRKLSSSDLLSDKMAVIKLKIVQVHGKAGR